LEFPAAWCYHGPGNRRDRAAERFEKTPLGGLGRSVCMGADVRGGSC
jgi:hypothetical protein